MTRRLDLRSRESRKSLRIQSSLQVALDPLTGRGVNNACLRWPLERIWFAFWRRFARSKRNRRSRVGAVAMRCENNRFSRRLQLVRRRRMIIKVAFSRLLAALAIRLAKRLSLYLIAGISCIAATRRPHSICIRSNANRMRRPKRVGQTTTTRYETERNGSQQEAANSNAHKSAR